MATHCPKCKAENLDTASFCADCGTQLIESEAQDVAYTKTLLTPVKDLTKGTLFANRYEIIEELGKGGMGKVYKAVDKEIHEEVAIKLLKPEIAADEKIIERFRNELKIARKITHKNVCRTFHIGKEDGNPYITMEFVPGVDLKSLIKKKGKLPKGEALNIAKQVCAGLTEAHKLGVVHRDLKPQNIMIDESGNAKIMDFGIARSLEAEGVTEAGMIIGTPDYISPEQAEGEEADQRSDIYSLGVILYEMVTGTVPFRGDTAFSVALKHKSQLPQDPRKLNGEVADDLARLILICMEKARERRYQTAESLLDDLRNIEEGLPLGTKIRPRRATFTQTLLQKKLLIPALIVIAALVIGVLIWQLLSKEKPAQVILEEHSIAVLPFVDLSPSKEHEYLCDGIPETLINALSGLEGLYVSARTSSFSFKGKQQDIREIGQKLGVGALLEGSVQVAGNKLRIMLRLINIENGFPIWSEDYNQTMDDVFVIQDDIAHSVVKALKIKLMGEDEPIVKNYTANREAYDVYLRGRFFLRKRGRENIEKAIDYFERALELDSNYALTYSGLADSYTILGDNSWIPAKEAFSKAKAAAMKALEIDEGLAEAQLALTTILYEWEHNFKDAEIKFQIALELKPSYATAHHWYAFYLSSIGRHDEAIEEILKARRLDPLSPRINANVGLILYRARQYERALEELKKSLELFPEHSANYYYIARVYGQLGRFDDAIKAILQDIEMNDYLDTSTETWLAYYHALSGNRAEARKRLSDIIEYSEKDFIPCTEIARVYIGLGDKEQAFNWLEKAFSENESKLLRLKTEPTFDPLRSDPRFTELLKKMGFEE